MASFSLDDERRWHADQLDGLRAAEALQVRINGLPVRARLEAYRRAGAGEALALVVAELEGGT